MQVHVKKSPASVYGKGKGKAILFAAAPTGFVGSDSDDDAASMVGPIHFSSDECFQAALLDCSHCEASECFRLADAPPKAGDMLMSPSLCKLSILMTIWMGISFVP